MALPAPETFICHAFPVLSLRHDTSGMFPYTRVQTQTQDLLNTRARNNKVQVTETKLWEIPVHFYYIKVNPILIGFNDGGSHLKLRVFAIWNVSIAFV